MLQLLFTALALYTFFLVLRFPYQTLVESSIARLETATGAKVTYTPVSAGILGVEMKDVSVQMPSGARLTCREAWLHPGFSGLSAHLSQLKGSGQVTLNGSQDLHFKFDKLEVETGVKELGKSTVTCDMDYNLRSHEGKGDVGLVVPHFQAALPIPEMPLEVGTKVQIAAKELNTSNQVTEVRAEVHMVGGTQFTADGPVMIQSRPVDASPSVQGSLQFKTPGIRGTLNLKGTLRDLKWDTLLSR